MGVGSSSKVVPPSLSSVKSISTFAEYPCNSLSQIHEAHQYYCQSQEYFNRIPVMTFASFEEVFGQLFPDPLAQFSALQQGHRAANNAVLASAAAMASAMQRQQRSSRMVVTGNNKRANNASSSSSKFSSSVHGPQASQAAQRGGTMLSFGSSHSHSLSAPAGSGSVVILDVFFILVLFCAAGIKDKLFYLCGLNRDADTQANALRIDTIQLLVYRTLQAMQIAFKVPIPNRDEVYSFLDYSIKQFLERNTLTLAHALSSKDSSINAAINSKTLSFEDFWQWCQDVNQISLYLDSISSVCLHLQQSADRSKRGRAPQRSSIYMKSFSLSNGPLSEGNALQDISQKITQRFDDLDLSRYSQTHRNPCWSFTLRDLVSEHWFEPLVLDVSVEDRVFTALEHMILSPRRAVPIFAHSSFTRQPSANASSHPSTAASTSSTSGSAAAPQATSFRGDLNNEKPTARGTSFSVNARMSSVVASPAGSRAPSVSVSAPVPVPVSLSVTMGASSSHISSTGVGSNAITAQLQSIQSLAQATKQDMTKFDLIGAFDFASVFAWILHCAPDKVLEQYKDKERAREEAENADGLEERDGESGGDNDTDKETNDADSPAKAINANINASYDENDNTKLKPSLRTALLAETSEKSTATKRLSFMPSNDLSGKHRKFSKKPSVVVSNMKLKQQQLRNKALNDFRSQWQTMGERAALSPISDAFLQEVDCPYYYRRYDLTSPFHHVYYIDQPIYNIILLFAQGFKYVPVTQSRVGGNAKVSSSPPRLLHVVEPFELAGFLFNNFNEFFLDPHHNVNVQALQHSVAHSGLMKEPVIIEKDVNIGTAFYILLKSKYDAAIILDENGKVGSVLSVNHLEKLWWLWKQQHLNFATDLVTLEDLRDDYSNGVYPVFPTVSANQNSGTKDAFNFSLFSCFLNPLELGNLIGIDIVSFDKFIDRKEDPNTSKLNTQSISTTETSITEEDSSVVTDSITSSGKFPTSPIRSASIQKPEALQATTPRGGASNASARPAFGGRSIRASAPGASTKATQSIKEDTQEEHENTVRRQRRTEAWFRQNSVISSQDSLRVALYMMYTSKLSCTYVVSPTGEPEGVIALEDICKYLIQQESRGKALHSEIVHRENAHNTRFVPQSS